MTQPIQEPSTDRSVSGLDWGQSQLARRPATSPGTGLSFATKSTGDISFDTGGANPYTYDVDLSGLGFVTNDPTLTLGVDPNTGLSAIFVPRYKLIRAEAVAMFDDVLPVDGQHYVDFKIGGAYSAAKFYTPGGIGIQFPSVADSALNFNDSSFGRHTIMAVAYCSYSSGATTDQWSISMDHRVQGMTTDPQDFKYGLSVLIVGDAPT